MKKAMALIFACLTVFAALTFSASARQMSVDEKVVFAKLNEGVTVNGQTRYLPADILVQAENYVNALPTAISSSALTTIGQKIDAAKQAIVAGGKADVSEWSDTTKKAVLKNIDEAAKEIGLYAVGNADGGINIMKAGQQQPVISNDTLIKKTGSADLYTFVMIGLGGIALLSACVVVSKKAKLF